MARSLSVSLFLCFLVACNKNNGSPSASGGNFYVSMDTSIGSASHSVSADTFLIHLKNPAITSSVPVVLHIPAGGRPDQGTKVNDSVWLDTVNISQNAVAMVNVTIGGKTTAYGIAYEFMINDYWSNALGKLSPESFYYTGDTLFVGSESGLYYSIDDGVNFTNVPSLASAAAAYKQGDGVNGVHVAGNTIYATVLAAVYMSRDGGKTFAEHDFTVVNSPTLTTATLIDGLFVQRDTLYLATQRGLIVTRDGGATYVKDTLGLGSPAIVFGVWAQGSTIYMATYNGLAVSTNGGSSFTMRTSGLGTIFGSNVKLSHCLTVAGGVLYVGTDGGLSISKDNGLTFNTVGMPNGMGGNQIYGIAVAGNLVCAATNGGLSISRDGGASFVNLNVVNGLADNWIGAVAIHGSKIFAGAVDENGGNPVVPGGLTVVTLRQ